MLLNALCEFYEKASKDGLIDEPGFTQKYIRWIIPIDMEGNLEGEGLIENPKKDGRLFTVPRTNRPKNAGGVSEFLWEGIESIFCLSSEPSKVEKNETKRKKQEDNRKSKYINFWSQIEQASNNINSDFLTAVVNFKKNTKVDTILKLEKEEISKSHWLIKTSSGNFEKYSSDNFTFQVAGNVLLDEDEVRKYWKNRFLEEVENTAKNAQIGLCLVTGKKQQPISPSHLPKITNVPGATPTGAALVSFDKDSFCSYGIEQSFNSPISLNAVEAYTNSLNFLVSSSKHKFRLGGITICFWAKQSEEVSSLFSEFLEKPKPEFVREFFKKPFVGNKEMTAIEQEKFYSVALTGNAGRIIVKNWIDTTVKEAIKNFHNWFQDLEIVKFSHFENEESPSLSLFKLALTTVREAKDLQTEIVLQLYRAALENHTPSLMLLKPILHRLSSDLARHGNKALNNQSRFALLRLIINRNKKENEAMIESDISEIQDDAYNCGRLLAIFDQLQNAAHDYKLEGAGVVERYYGSASSNPNSAFGILWRLHQHHLKKLSREKKGTAVAIKKQIEDLTIKFKSKTSYQAPQFPRTFNLQQQGRFALGFYQQKAWDRQQRDEYKKLKEENNNSNLGEENNE